jgi:hypothetical protein
VARLELLYMIQRPNQGDLHKVVGVHQVAGAEGEASVGKSAQDLKIAGSKPLSRRPVAVADQLKQGSGRF